MNSINIKEEIEKFNKNNGNTNILEKDEAVINNFINILAKNKINELSDKELEDVKNSVENIKKALNNEFLNTFDLKSFLKLWINDFLVY